MKTRKLEYKVHRVGRKSSSVVEKDVYTTHVRPCLFFLNCDLTVNDRRRSCSAEFCRFLKSSCVVSTINDAPDAPVAATHVVEHGGPGRALDRSAR